MNTPMMRPAAMMAARMRLFKKTAEQAAERKERVILHPAELWESEDQEALDAFEQELPLVTGAQPLPMEIP